MMNFALLDGSSVLTEGMKTAISQGVANLAATVTDVLIVTIPATIGIMALSAGSKYAIKAVKGAIAAAA